MEEKVIYLKGLNGLRALAVFGVILLHICTGMEPYHLPNLFSTSFGRYAVTLFFTLSGFLITFLIFKEKEKTQTVDVGKFYMRRILRIWPLYFFFILLCIPFITEQDLSEQSLLYFVFAPNIVKSFLTPNTLLIHYWSLGVEEQFYLFWPPFMRWVKKPLPLLLGFIFIMMCIRYGIQIYFGPASKMYYFIFDLQYESMAIGAVGAHFYVYYQHLTKFLNHWFFQILAWTVTILTIINKFQLFTIINHQVFAGITVMLIIQQTSARRNIINLNYPVFDYLGKISFGLYVYHPLVMRLTSIILAPADLPATVKYPLIFILIISTTIVIADLSYKYLEKPFLKIKAKYTIVKSSHSSVTNSDREVAEVAEVTETEESAKA